MTEGLYIKYRDIKFRSAALDTMGAANRVIDQYRADGFRLTLRQLYYRMVATGLIPENTDEQYQRLGRIISEGRIAGLVAWDAIEDRGRNLMGLDTQENVAGAIKDARGEYRLDLWRDQPCLLEAWVEKQALEGVIGAICNELRVNFFATKGYNSQSEQWRAGRRLSGAVLRGQRPIVLHLADHDPAGLDMTRDLRERLELFAGTPIQVVRLGLNMEQVRKYDPPPNYAKETDSKTPAYVEQYGPHCWELDALDPHVIHDLIRDAVAAFRDDAKWKAALDREAADLDELDVLIEERK